MARLRYSELFLENASTIQSHDKRVEIRHRVELLQTFPEMGSQDVSRFIKNSFGKHVRKLTIKPFVVVYEYKEKTDEVWMLGLIHQRAAL